MLQDVHGTVKRKVSYFYDPDIGNYHYGQGHPMKVSWSSRWTPVQIVRSKQN